MKTNPIIEAAKQKGNTTMHPIVGFLSKGSTGKIEIYASLDMKNCMEVSEADVVHIEESEKPTEPSIVFVRDQAPVVFHQQGTVTSATTSGSDSGCGCGGGITPLIGKGGGGGTGGGGNPILCGFLKALCVAGCQDKGWLKGGCLDSCSAAYRNCVGPIGPPVLSGF